MTHFPSARTSAGKQLGGERVRAVPPEGGDTIAVIELTDIPRTDNGKASLAYEFEAALRAVRQGYTQKNLAVDLGSLQSLQLGGLRSMATEITITAPDRRLIQWVGMTMSPGHIYSLTYSANEANYARYREQLDEVKKGLVLQ